MSESEQVTVQTPVEIAQNTDFSQLGTTYLAIAGAVIPTIIGILAAKKGIAWLLGFIRRA